MSDKSCVALDSRDSSMLYYKLRLLQKLYSSVTINNNFNKVEVEKHLLDVLLIRVTTIYVKNMELSCISQGSK